MSTNTPENVDRLDWRINNVTWLTEPFVVPGTNKIVPENSAVIQAGVFQFGKEHAGISIPSATALFLNLSYRAHSDAHVSFEKCLKLRDAFGHMPDGEVFAFYEHIMASVVFACTALEAFVNEQVPDNHVYHPKKRPEQSFDKVQIERFLSLGEKLGDVLPLILQVRSPKGGSLWGAFEKLERLRDRIIHMKTKDREHRGKAPKSIWGDLMKNPLPDTWKTAKRLIEYYFSKAGSKPRWFEKCPF